MTTGQDSRPDPERLTEVRAWVEDNERLFAAGQAAMTMTVQEATEKARVILNSLDALRTAARDAAIGLVGTGDHTERLGEQLQSALAERYTKWPPHRLSVQPILPDGKYLLFSETPRDKDELEAISLALTDWYAAPYAPLAVMGPDLALYRIDSIPPGDAEETEEAPQAG